MKHTRYSLRLDTPCSQPWDAMTPTPTGRHCGLCAKNVVDLTHLTDDQLLAILKKSGGTFCGRVTDAQLNRPLVSRTQTTLSARLFKLFAGLFLLASTDSHAQALIERRPLPLKQAPTSPDAEATRWAHDPNFSRKARIRAQLIAAETRQPVPDAYVSVMTPFRNGSARSATMARSDAEGYFDIAIPDSLVDQPARLVVHHSSYARKQVPLQVGSYPQLIELLAPPPPVTISGGGLVVVKRKWWQCRKRKGFSE